MEEQRIRCEDTIKGVFILRWLSFVAGYGNIYIKPSAIESANRDLCTKLAFYTKDLRPSETLPGASERRKRQFRKAVIEWQHNIISW